MHIRFFILIALLGAFLLPACGSETHGTPQPVTCIAQSDCPGTSYCQNGICIQPSAQACVANFECSDGLVCLSSGVCGPPTECINDADCCSAGALACTSTCQEGSCIGSECASGVQEACYVDCNKGVKVCVNGTWKACDANPKTEVETCNDGIDNDCNGSTDEGCPECTPGDQIECSSECGTGVQICNEFAAWTACDAPNDCTCNEGEVKSESCGNCGYQEYSCSPDGTWLQPGLCQGQGSCSPGDEEIVDCGACGAQVRTCQDDCTWSEFGECEGAGECEPGTTKSTSCGTCGTQEETCNSSCSWEITTVCEEGLGCAAGEIQEITCGLCGVQQSVCNATCEWGDFGACTGEGVCSPGQNQTEDCGNCGERTRSCREDCTWGDWSSCGGSGACSPGQTSTESCGPSSTKGICKKGEHYRTCNTNCQWSAWSTCQGAVYSSTEICGNGIDENCDGKDLVILDQYEPNDDCYSCYYLGEDQNIVLEPTTDDPYDADYFCFDGKDGTFDPTEEIKVYLKDQPIGMDNDIALYKGMDACVAKTPIASSVTVGGQDETISWGEGVLSDDNALYIIRVQPYESGNCYMPYTLEINGLN